MLLLWQEHDRTPRLAAALGMVTSGMADVLVVAKLNRPARSLLDLGSLMALCQVEE